MDVCPKNLRQPEGLHNGVKTLRFRVAAMWCAVNDKEVYLLSATQFMEELDFLANPFRLSGMGRADDYQIP